MYNLERFFPKCLTQSAFKNFKNTFYGQDLKKKKTPASGYILMMMYFHPQ